jgi:penicillin-binding protein 1A
LIRFTIGFIKFILFIAAISFPFLVFTLFYYSKDLPTFDKLENYKPSAVTRIYSRDGKLIEEYSKEKRVFVPISSMPRILIDAFVAAEDKNFYHHQGIDFLGILRASVDNIFKLLNKQRVSGASTITQQVVKNFLLSNERTIDRKIKEALLAYKISKHLSKDKILELYLNQIYLGKNSYGVATAALSYFDKSIEDLSVEEAAFLAALPKAPSQLDPSKNYEKVLERRNYVIIRMLEDGYITKEVAKSALQNPINIKTKSKVERVSADYFAEEVRREIVGLYGEKALYEGGLVVITSLDSRLQKYAEDSIKKGILNFDQKKGINLKIGKVDPVNFAKSIESFAVHKPYTLDDVGVVVDIKADFVTVGIKGGGKIKIYLQNIRWLKSHTKDFRKLLQLGDVILVEKNVKNNEDDIEFEYSISQVPNINGAIIVANPYNGEILAMQGGYNFDMNKFNRATMAQRQPGSTFKTFVYLTAIENDIPATQEFSDGPISIDLGYNLPIWSPKNYKSDYLGTITMREAFEKSRNLVTVRLILALGLDKVTEMSKRLSIYKNPEHALSIGLGSLDTTLDKITFAYAPIINGGYKVSPSYIDIIKDSSGKVIYKKDKRICNSCKSSDKSFSQDSFEGIDNRTNRVLDEDTAFIAKTFLLGAVKRGTGRAAYNVAPNIGGKTGTTNDSLNTSFIGFNDFLLVGTYIGYDTPRDMGKNATGASVSLPVFVDFMSNATKIRDYNEAITLEVPSSVEVVNDEFFKIGQIEPINIPKFDSEEVYELKKIYNHTKSINKIRKYYQDKDEIY